MRREIEEIPMQLICEEVFNPRPWKYEAYMVVFGKKRFLTYADTIKDVKKTARRRLKALLLKSEVPN